ncbi:hypothetical protein NDU88_005880 [Pleurodeles waltl]|uniref:Uncharacterized protein n=1 Tax=Pleurodeles waltl TaxID=8319 RepID=A0AAV7LQB4_PLEWA|nr:hypothetical protein NDU88_005880 [Pleurodeles waltl]
MRNKPRALAVARRSKWRPRSERFGKAGTEPLTPLIPGRLRAPAQRGQVLRVAAAGPWKEEQTAGHAEERTPQINSKRRGCRTDDKRLQPLDPGALTGAGGTPGTRRAPEAWETPEEATRSTGICPVARTQATAR